MTTIGKIESFEVCGLRNMQIQKRLLSEAKLKYSKAVEIAVALL